MGCIPGRVVGAAGGLFARLHQVFDVVDAQDGVVTQVLDARLLVVRTATPSPCAKKFCFAIKILEWLYS